MTTPDFVLRLRAAIGHDPLWLIGASAIVLRPGDTGQQVLLGKRSDSGRWSSIDGIAEPGEAPEETAVRECLEETELAVEVERLVMTGVLGPIRYPNGDVCSFVDHVFRCHVTGGRAGTGDRENTAVRWFGVDTLPADIDPVVVRRIRVAVENPREVVLAGRYLNTPDAVAGGPGCFDAPCRPVVGAGVKAKLWGRPRQR